MRQFGIILFFLLSLKLTSYSQDIPPEIYELLYTSPNNLAPGQPGGGGGIPGCGPQIPDCELVVNGSFENNAVTVAGHMASVDVYPPFNVNGADGSENIVTMLGEPLVPGETYTLSFWYTFFLTQLNSSGPDIVSAFAGDPTFDANSLPTVNLQISFDNGNLANNLTDFGFNFDVGVSPVVITPAITLGGVLIWQEHTVTFTVPLTAPGNIDQLYFFPDVTFPVYTPPPGDANGIYLLNNYVDNLSIEPVLDLGFVDGNNILVSTDETCPGLNDGTLDFTPGPDVTNWIWTGPSIIDQSAEDHINLSPGAYTLELFGVHGCSEIHTFNIDTGFGPVDILVTNESCPGEADGSINVFYGNPATYLWSGPNGFNSMNEDISGLSEGDYQVIITDNATSCQEIFSASVYLNSTCCDNLLPNPDFEEVTALNQPNNLGLFVDFNGWQAINSAELVPIDNDCPIPGDLGNNTSYNGDPNNLYFGCLQQVFGNGGSMFIQLNNPLPPGSYEFSFNVRTCFSANTTVNVALSDLPMTQQDFDGNGNPNFSIMASEDVLLNEYDLNNWATQTVTFNVCENGLEYFGIGIESFNGNTTSYYGHFDGLCLRQTYQIPGITENISNESCPGAEDGEIIITYNEPADFDWSATNFTSQNQNIIDLGADDYQLTINDLTTDCVIDMSYPVLLDLPCCPDWELQVQATIVHETCAGENDGSIELTNDGYTYNWQTISSTSNTEENLAPGTYPVEVTDVNTNCSEILEFEIEGGQTIDLEITEVENESCPGAMNGSIDITYSTSAEYSWTGPNDFTANIGDIENLAAGTYTLTVTNFLPPMCQETFTVTLQTNLDSCCEETGGTISINNNETWNQDAEIYSDILVTTGTTLTIENCEIQFAPDVTLYVEQGALLQVNNSTLTTLDYCDEMWNGVEIWGQNLAPQLDAIQGRINLFNSTISNARVGTTLARRDALDEFIEDSGGGIINSQGSTFLNNERDVDFSEFFPWVAENQSVFVQTDFILDPNYNNLDGGFPEIRVKMHRAPGIRFRLCNFLNNDADLLETPFLWMDNPQHPIRLRAIDAWSSNFVALNCLFNDFSYGIRNIGSIPNSGDAVPPTINYLPLQISECQFNCYRGTYLLKPGFTIVTGTTYNPLNSGANLFNPSVFDEGTDVLDWLWFGPIEWTLGGYGLYMDTPSRFFIEENLFNMDNGSSIGAIVANNQSLNNTVFDNEFTDNQRALNFLHNNRGESPLEGLKFECNDFDNNLLDVRINALTTTPETGINLFQGSFTQSAGNDMSNSNSGQAFDDINNLTGNFHFHFFTGDELNPAETSFNVLTPDVNFENPSCPTFGVEDGSNDGIFEGLADFEEEYYLSKAEWLAVVDGGDSESLTEEVINSEFAEALELYYELMGKSPNLSEQVMVEAIEKEFDLPMVLLKQILQSNPQAAKSTKIQKKLDDRLMPLPEYMREQINQGLEWVSYKEQLEAEMSFYKTRYDLFYNYQLSQIWQDDDITDKQTAIEALEVTYAFEKPAKEVFYSGLANAHSPEEKISYCQNNSSTFMEDELFLAEINDLILVLELERDLNDGTETLSQVNEGLLMSIVSEPHVLAFADAVRVLQLHTGKYYLELVSLPDIPISQRASAQRTDDNEKLEIKVYPNPASDFIIVELAQWPLTDKATYQVVNIEGKVVLEGNLQSGEDLVIDLIEVQIGTYQLLIRDQLEVIHSSQFIVK